MKEIAWFKAIKGRNAKYKIVIYYAVREDGSIRYADVARLRTATINSFSSKPLSLEISTQEEYNKAVQTIKDK